MAELVHLARDCDLEGVDNNTEVHAAYDAYGLSWQRNFDAQFAEHVAKYANQTGLRLGYRARTMPEYIANWVEVWPRAGDPGPNDWWLLGGEVFAEDIGHGAFLDLTGLLSGDDSFRLADIPPQFRDAGSSAYAGRFSAMPLWLTTYQLLYRRDIFEARNMTPPDTWAEVLAIAEQYGNGKLGPGQPELAFCFESNPACGYAHAAVIYILASMVQLTGPSHGAWFDPDTLEPLYQGEAFREALRIYGELRRHTVSDDTACGAVYDGLESGRCLMTWGFSYGFKRASHRTSAMRGRQGVEASPGSPVALDRRTGRLVPCTKELCPLAVAHNHPTTGESVLVNHVTPVDTVSFAINAFAPLYRQAASYAILHTFCGYANHARNMLAPESEIAPTRYSELDADTWINAGYDADDVAEFLEVYRADFDHTNTYYELRIPGVFDIYWVMQRLLEAFLHTNATFEQLTATALAATEEVFNLHGGRTALLPLYQRSLNYKPPAPASAEQSGSSDGAKSLTLVAVLVPVLSCLVLLAAGLWGYLHWRRLAHEKRDRLLAAPGPGPGTTLLVTDIQDSTCLWESLPAEAMDSAVKLHHRVIRELLLPHHGYETATEGDSFLLAFHKPDSALGFALAAQSALLSADWPAELLSSPYAATLRVRHDAAAWATIAPCITAPLLQEALAFAALEAGGLPDRKRLSQPRGSLDVARQPGSDGHQQRRRRGVARRMSLGALTSTHPPPSTPPLSQPPDNANTYWQPRRVGSPLPAAGPALAAAHAQMLLRAGEADPELGLSIAVQAVVGEACNRSASSHNQEQPRNGRGGAAVSSWVAPGDSVSVVANIAAPSVHSDAAPRTAASAHKGIANAAALPPRAPARLWPDSNGSSWRPAKGASLHCLLPPSAAAGTHSATDPECNEREDDDATAAAPGWVTDAQAGALRAAHLTQVSSVTQSLDDRTCDGALDTTNTAASQDAAASAAELMTGHSFFSAAGHRQRRQSRLVNTSELSGISFKEALRLGFPAGASSSDLETDHGLGGDDWQLASTASASRKPACARADSGLLIFRGLRVRMGLHCGLGGPAEVQYNRASGRITYPGGTMAMAKAVSDVGRGGNILLSSRVARALDQKATHSGAYVLLAVGGHVLKDGEEPVQLVAAFPRSLVPRAGHLLAPRSVEEKVPGVLSAPLGRAAVGVAQVQDAEEFAGWGLESSLESHRALLRDVGACAAQRGGYLVTTAPGSFQAVFTAPAAAMTWLLTVQAHMAPTVQSCGNGAKDGARTATGSVADLAPRSRGTSISGSVDTRDAVRQLKRATAFARLSILHLRGGVDVGPVQACLAEAGEASYSGGAVKRAACLAAHAAWHEVLVSLEAAREVIGIRGELSSAAIPRSGASPAPAAAAGSPAAPFWLSSRKRMTHISEAAGDSMLVQSPQASSLQLSTPGMQSGISGMSSTTQQLPSATVSGPAAAEEIEAASGWDGAAALTPSASGDVGAFFRRAGVRATPGAGSGTVTPDRGTPRVTVRAPSHLGMRAREGGAAAMMLNPASHRPASAVVMPVARLPASAMGQLLGLPPAAGPAPLPVDAASVRPLQHEGQEEQQRPLDIGLGQEQQGDDETKEPPAEFAEPYVQQEGGGAVMDAADTNRDGSFTHVPPAIPAPASLPIHRIHHSQVETLRVPAASVSGAAGAPAQRPSVRELLRNRAVNFLRQQAARVSGGGLVAARLAPPVGAASASGADRSHTDLQMRPSLLGMAASASGAYDTAASPSSRVAERAPRALFAKSVVEVAVHTVSSGPALAKSGKAEGDAAGGAAEPAVEVLVFSREVLAVKHRGSALEACVVRLGGVRTAGPGVGAGAGARPKPAALAASGNATDSYGLFWQVETAAPFQAFVATLNNATGLHNRYRGRTMVWPNASFVGPNDWWMIGGDVYGEDVNHGVFLETGRLLQQDLDYQVSDIPVAFRNAGTSAYAGRFSALPLWLTTYQLLYRRDIFEARNITPPRTWDEAIAVAEQYGNGKLGPGQPELGFCFESKPACGYAHAAVIYILASMVQLTGPSHGAWFDPDTLEPLYQGVAFREALRIYRTLRRHSVPDATPCWEVYRSIASGRCLMMWGFAYGFKAASHNSSAMSGRQGVAPSPGSTLALDRRTGRLQPCTKELCPFAAPHVEPGTGRSVLVNVVTPIDTLNLAINALSPVNRQAAAYIMLRNFTRPAEHTRVMLMPKTEVVPMRYSQLDEKLWTDAGYNPTDVGDFLQTYRNYFASQNVYYELRIPGVFPIYWLLHNTMIKALYTNATDDELIAFAVGGTEPIFDANGGRARLTRLYQLSLGYVPPKQASAAEQHATTTLLVAVLVPVLSCLVLLAAGLWGYLHWRRLAHEKRDRLLAAPGPGPGTTLLVTDIQDSTCLWESLPAEAMDTAVKLHHRVIRELLLPHHGYETATEGDSFLLAFHKPNGALGFALAAQAALLSADWPAELLSSPYAATCCVRHDALVWATIAPCISAPLLHDAIAAAAMEAGGASQVCMSVAGGAMGMPRRASDAGRSSLAQGQLLSSNGMASPSPVQGHGGLLSRAPAAIQEGFVLDAPLYDDDGGGGVDASDSSAHSRRQQEPQQQQPQQQQTDTAISAACEAGFFSGVSAFTTASGCAALPPAVAARADAGLWTSGGVDDSGGSNTGTPGYASGANASANTSANGCATPVAAPSCGMPVVTRCTQVRAQPSDKPPRPYAVVSSRGTSRGGSRLSVLPPGRALGAPQQQQLLQQPNSRPPSGTMAFLARTDAGSEAGGDSTGHSRRSLPLLLAGLGAEAAAGGAAAASAAGGSNRPDSTVSQRSHHGGRGGAAVGMTLKEALQLSFPEVAAAGGPLMQPGLFHQPATAVIFRGLRVRMGLHCGLSGPAEVQYNRASGRITYPGRTMAMAKAVSDVGRGGNILLSSRVARALDQKATHSGAYVLLAAGRHVLKDGEEPVQLVAAFPRSLLPRAGHLLAPRSVEEKVPGVLSAPLGRAAVGVAQVQDAEDFAGWGLESSLESHRALLRQAGWLAGKHGGYLVTTAPGSFQAVFTLPAAAITWLLALQDEVAPALHDAVDLAAANAARCRSDDDDTAYNSPSRTSYAGSGSGSRDDELVLQRATMRARLSILHLRGGVDVGPVQACLAEAGEASYSGGAVKRAACLAAHAAWHEVLVSLEAAREVTGEAHPGAAAHRNALFQVQPRRVSAPNAASLSASGAFGRQVPPQPQASSRRLGKLNTQSQHVLMSASQLATGRAAVPGAWPGGDAVITAYNPPGASQLTISSAAASGPFSLPPAAVCMSATDSRATSAGSALAIPLFRPGMLSGLVPQRFHKEKAD
ncbi:hypothetical protein HYH02_000183, partial [Chlamydomonas schloesseri]